MNTPQDPQRETRIPEVEPDAARQPAAQAGPRQAPGTPTWLKIVLIVVVGIPVGLALFAAAVLGMCLLGSR